MKCKVIKACVYVYMYGGVNKKKRQSQGTQKKKRL